MEFKGAIGVLRRRAGWLGGLAGALLLFLTVVTATAEPPERLKRLMDRGGLTPAGHISGLHQMDRNRVLLLLPATFGAAGAIGGSGSSVANGGFWISTNNPYIFSSGPVMGATIPSQTAGKRDTVVFIGGPFPQQSPGSALFPELAASGGIGVFWDSTEEADIAAGFPAPCTVDDFRIQLFPSLSPFRGLPFPGFADQTVCGATNDVLGPISADAAGRRMGAEVVYTLFAFSVPAVQDFVFVAFRIFNASQFVNASNAPIQIPGPYDLEEMSVGIAIDPDVGDSGDDQITFFPDLQTMVYWDNNFSEAGFIGVPGFGAVMYLKTPVDPATGEEVGLANFTLFVRGTIRPDPVSAQEWYEGLTGDPDFVAFEVQPTDIRGLAASGLFTLPAGEFVEIYGAFFFADVFGTPPSQLLAESPFTRVGGQLIPNPAANDDPAFTNIKRVAPTAQAVFNAGFIVPTAPTSPNPGVKLIPGDGQVTIVWDARSVEAVNPFAKIARDPFARLPNNQPDPEAPGTGVILDPSTVIFDPATDTFRTAAEAGLAGAEVTNPAFNPRFAIADFQGFRVYRSRTGALADVELIAQFDVVDNITGGDFCVSAIPVFDEEGDLIQVVCIEQQNFPIGTNSGLAFSLVDRGGTFPNPSTGGGLINGIPVFYSVTAFSVNCGQTPVSGPFDPFAVELAPPPACLVLESGLSPLQSATPRSESSAFVGASVGEPVLLDGDGNPLPRDSGPIPVADLAGPIPPARDWSMSVEVLQPLEIPEEFVIIFRIDSMPVSPGFASPFGCSGDDTAESCVFGVEGVFDEIAGGDGRSRQVWFTVTDGDGNVLQTVEGPAIGSFLTDFISFTGSAPASSPSIQILSPTDPSKGVALSVVFTLTRIGSRAFQCSLAGTCELLAEDGSGLPASVASARFSRGLYGQIRVADIEITWSNQGGVLGLSEVRDISNNVNLFFTSGFGTEQWGFARATGLAGPEMACALDPDCSGIEDLATTDDGKVLFPTPFCGFPGNCVNYGFLTPFTQAAPVFTDLPFDPQVFDRLAPFRGQYAAVPFHQPGALSETAALVNVGGNKGTRLYISGHWLDVVFNALPSDGEKWLIRLPLGNTGAEDFAEAPRSPVPGQSVRVELSGGTNVLAEADLSRIAVVPNPFIVANEITRGQGRQRILFNNLPPVATIRIYTISGNLVRIMEHADGSGTAEWDVRTRFDLLAASGNYYFHVTTPDGRTHLGRLAIVN